MTGIGKPCAVDRGKGEAKDSLLFDTMVVQKLEDVIGPDGGSKITKGVTVLRGIAVRRIDLHFVRPARVLHYR